MDMAKTVYKIYDQTQIGASVPAGLGDSINAAINLHVTLVSTDSTAVYGWGTAQAVKVLGSVIGYVDGVSLGDEAADAGCAVFVGKQGYVYGQQDAVSVLGSAARVSNNGIIDSGHSGVKLTNDTVGTVSEIINNGSLMGRFFSAEFYGAGDFKLTNNGTIIGTVAASAYVAGHVRIVNNGDIQGAVTLGTGDDIYNGSKGRVHNDDNVLGIIDGSSGDDRIIGGTRSDRIIGGLGADTLTGAGGADRFQFKSVGESTAKFSGRDLITDFRHGQHDVLDLSYIDGFPEDDTKYALKFIGNKPFNGDGGELAYRFDHGNTLVMADIDGDKKPDLAIELDGRIDLVKADFIL
jgi:Ca2+-binding RTX toxin-like protein